jgi:hypothetical protein
VLRSLLEEPEASCVRELRMRRGAARTAVFSMAGGCLKESVSVKRTMEQRKGEMWTSELGELRSCFVSITIFFGIRIFVT